MSNQPPLSITMPDIKVLDGGKKVEEYIILTNNIEFQIDYRLERLDKDSEIVLEKDEGSIAPHSTEKILVTFAPSTLRLKPVKLEIRVVYDFLVE